MRGTWKHPIVTETRGDTTVTYRSPDNPIQTYHEGWYERGNYAVGNLVFWFKWRWEWLCGAFAYLRGVRL